MTHEELLGLVLWVLIFYPIWSPRCRRIRRQQRVQRLIDAQPKKPAPKPKQDRQDIGPGGRIKSSAAYEQDVPYPECFEEDDL